jgi:hypothetical protein
VHERDECRAAERAGEVGDRVAGGHNQIEIHHHGGAVEKRSAACIEVISQCLDPLAEPDGLEFLDAAPLLQRDETHARDFAQRSEFAQRDRPQLVHMRGAGILPGDSDLEAMAAEAFSPGRHAVGLGCQKRPTVGHRFGRDTENCRHAHHGGPAETARPFQSSNIGNDAFHAGHGPQQRFQARLGPQCDPVSLLGEMGAEAGEQEMVAETCSPLSTSNSSCRRSPRQGGHGGGEKPSGMPILSAMRRSYLGHASRQRPVQQFDQGDCIEGFIVVRCDLKTTADIRETLNLLGRFQEARLGAVRVE